MKTIQFIFIILSSLVMVFPTENNPEYQEKGFSDLNLSPAGNYLVYSTDENPGLFLLDINTNEAFQISAGLGSAFQAAWSENERYIGFKLFKKAFQVPALFDLQKNELIELAPPSMQAGVPSFSGNDQVVFTIGKHLIIKDLNTLKELMYMLPNYANLTPVSPDGSKIIFNDPDDQIWLFDLVSSEKLRLTNYETGYYEPVWSPDGRNVLVSSFGGKLNIINIASGNRIDLGIGNNPRWIENGDKIVFSKTEFFEGRAVVNMDLFSVNVDGKNLTQLTYSAEWEAYPASSSDFQTFYTADRHSGDLLFYANDPDKRSNLIHAVNYQTLQPKLSAQRMESAQFESESLSTMSSTAVFFDIPYVHQRYDTPNWFDGNWACGATSASMCLAYYGLIEPWPVTVSSPYSHTSDYGNYICEIYSYNDFTFNIWASDPQGRKGYGGYGFIVRNGSQAWHDTKGYMAEYARKHGLESSVDWNPSRSKLMNEADSKRPFVLLNSLTSSGHYISVIGYENNATTVIVNDPYGDKNRGYANYYGKRAKYDWPGYSNGHSSLNTVHCYIYFKGHIPGYADLAVESIQVQDSCNTGETVFFRANLFNRGDTTSSPCTLKYILSSDNVYNEEDFILGTEDLPAIGAGDSIAIEEELTVPDSMFSGRFYIGAMADAEKENSEVNHDNNFGYSGLVVCGYPEIYYVNPKDSAAISNSDKPEIMVKYKDLICFIDAESFSLFIDGIDITDSCVITTRKAVYTPKQAMEAGEHKLLTSVSNRYGFTMTRKWQFTIAPQTGLNDQKRAPTAFVLEQNYPNPFNPETSISYSIAVPNNVQLSVYNIIGQKVADLVNIKNTPGNYTVQWNAAEMPSGIYFYRLIAGSETRIRKMILRK